MKTIQDLNAKTLHDITGQCLEEVQGGQPFRVYWKGELAGLLVPPDTQIDPAWDEIMAEVWAAQNEPVPTRPNPILVERKKRNYAARLR